MAIASRSVTARILRLGREATTTVVLVTDACTRHFELCYEVQMATNRMLRVIQKEAGF
jgi:hypothetical protein